jgi:mono/diheme cytochrome c family protein
MTSDKLADGKTKSGPKPQVLGIFLVFIMVAVAGGIIVYSLSDWSAPAKAKAMPNPISATPQAIGAGMSIYMDRCQNCHGEDGNGKGERAEKLSVAPADFTDAHAMSTQTDGELFWKISEGHRPMPAFEKKLSEEERWQLVDYIRTFSQSANPPPFAAPDKGAVPK